MTDRPNAPEPLVTSADDAALRALLEAGRSELPTRDQLASLATKLGPVLAPGKGGGNGGGATGRAVAKAGSGAVLGKVVGGAILVVALGVGTRHALRAPTTSPVASVAQDAPAPPPAENAPPFEAASAPPASPPRSLSLPTRSRVTSPHASAAPAASEDPNAEVTLLQDAHAALQSDPARTLALCAEHARRFPNGLMAQEREALAIEALVQQGQMPEARARADRFEAAYPTSTHLRRIRAVLGTSP